MAGRQGCPWILMAQLMLAVLCCYSSRQSTVRAQSAITDFVYSNCAPGVSSSDGTFGANLNRVMSALQNDSSRALYANASTATGTEDVYGMYQCRGDLSLGQCSECVSAIGAATTKCPNNVGMRVQLQGCYLRYEDNNFLTADDRLATNSCRWDATIGTGAGPSSYLANLRAALNVTAQEAPSHAGYFWAASQGAGRNASYALAQCVGYLSPSQCASCLSQASNFSAYCQDSIAGQVYFFTCYYLYSNTSLLFNASTSTASAAFPPPPGPPSLIPPALSLSPAPSRPPPAYLSTAHEKNKTPRSTAVAVGFGVAAGVLALFGAAAAVLLLCRQRRRRLPIKQGTSHTPGQPTSLLNYHFQRAGATQFTFDELRHATNDFDPQNKLGEGGFGPVYKGHLTSGREAAIKVLLSSESAEQDTSEFIREVNVINTIQHRNLTQLLGCCVEGPQRLLVYEYIPNGSLDLFLFDSDQEQTIGWGARFEIIVGIARGLSYLHEDAHFKIVHRDIKASNILLDNEFTAKIADFGLARFFNDDDTHVITKVAGTRGYVAPEYALGGQLTEKADVYSFGIVALEIVSGRRIIDERLLPEKEDLLKWAWLLFDKRRQGELLDPKVDDLNVDEVMRVVHVALLCTQMSPNTRPTMTQVCAMLFGQSETLALPSKLTIPIP